VVPGMNCCKLNSIKLRNGYVNMWNKAVMTCLRHYVNSRVGGLIKSLKIVQVGHPVSKGFCSRYTEHKADLLTTTSYPSVRGLRAPRRTVKSLINNKLLLSITYVVYIMFLRVKK
jgi:hypothetical protein